MRCYLLDHPELLAKFRQGDRQVLGQVWDFYLPQLRELFGRGFITKKGLRVPPLKNPDDLADAISPTYLLAFANAARLGYDGKRPFFAYLATIARNALVSHHRKHGRELPSSGRDDYEDADVILGDGPAEPEKSRVDPKAHAVLQEYLNRQPERLRALVNARHVDDLTDQQTADKLGVSPTRVRQLEARMLEELRQLLKRAGVRSSADRLTPSPGEPSHG